MPFGFGILLSETTPAFDVASIMQDSVTKVQGDLYSVLGIVVPVLAGIAAAVVCVTFGFKWLKKMGKI